MSEGGTDISGALRMLYTFDWELWEIILLSLRVSLVAVVLATIIGLPLGAALALYRFPGRHGVIIVLNALMGLPPVVVGLVFYLLLSNTGPLGFFQLLFTPGAMIIAQSALITPIVAAITRQIIGDLWAEYEEQLYSLGTSRWQAVGTLIWDGRFALLTGVLAGFGRASAEVGAVMIVGGNIAHYTRVMTTAIALETSKGDLQLALGLGIVLMLLALVVNGFAYVAKEYAERVASGARP